MIRDSKPKQPSPKSGAVRKGATLKGGSQPRKATKNATSEKTKHPKKPKQKSLKSANASNASGLLKHHRDCIQSSLTRIRLTKLASLMTSSLVAVSLTLPMLLLLVVSNLQVLSAGWQNQLSVSVYLDVGLSDASVAGVEREIQQMPGVSSQELITPDQGLADFKSFAGSDLLSLFDQNPLPAVIEVVPLAEHLENPQFALNQLALKLKAIDGVEDVAVDLQWVERLLNYVSLAERFAWLVGFLLALAAVLAISNSIRLEIENRRQEIVVIKLVGGTDSFIRLPFLYSGFWYGVLGAVIASVCLILISVWLSPIVSDLLFLYSSDIDVVYFGFSDLLGLFSFSVLISVLGAWLAVYRHLGEIEPE